MAGKSSGSPGTRGDADAARRSAATLARRGRPARCADGSDRASDRRRHRQRQRIADAETQVPGIKIDGALRFGGWDDDVAETEVAGRGATRYKTFDANR